MEMKKLFMILIILPCIMNAVEIDFEPPHILQNRFLNDLPTKLNIGAPAVPFVPIKLLLPMGEEFENLEVQFINENTMKINDLDFVREPQPIALKQPDKTVRNEAIYQKNEFYPTMGHEVLGTQRYRGYDLLLINLFPYKYNPLSGEIIWFEKAIIKISSVSNPAIREDQNKKLIINDEMQNSLQRTALNLQEVNSYQKSVVSPLRTLVDPDDPHTLVIITDSIRAAYFSDFIAWKIAQGTSTALFLTEDIYTEYAGQDNPDKIRNFIIDAYQTYSATDTPLKHVILGGDDEIIPIRAVFIDTGYGTVDTSMPCDAYFSCLDGDWDANGNGIYGEVDDEVDFIPEIAVGRITAETESEFNRFFNKNYHYVDQASVSDDIVYKFGENLNYNPLTWGGDYMDEVIAEVPNLQEDYHIFKLYDREGTYSPYAVKEAINSGVAIINHMGHSNEMIVFGQNSAHCASYTNTEYGFAYSQGCYPAAFDEATSQQGESIAENLIIAERGLFAFVGNTRYGWYSPGSTNGPSQPYDIEFFRAIFTNDIRSLGEALSESRVVMANEAMSNAFLRWVHYQLVLFGDSSVEVKYANGSFPYLVPGDVVYEDFNTGDGDGIPNPGEEIEIFISLENLEGWSDATDVSATISFDDDTIQIINDTVTYGFIANGSAASSDPFIVQIPQNCNYDAYHYTLSVHAPVSGETAFNKDYSMSFEVSLFQKNWPWITTNSIVSNAMIYDFNDDGSKDFVIIDAQASINLLSYNANMVSGYPWINSDNIWKSTALADITGDEFSEIIFASRSGRIFAVDNLGDIVLDHQTASDQLLTPIVSDFNGDGQNEIASFGLDKHLNIIDAEGNMLNNFPIELPMLTFQEMAAADLTGDSSYELLIGSLNGELNAFDSNGQQIAGFPIQLGAATCSAPIVLDNLKIVIGTIDNKLFILNNSGEILLEKDTEYKIAASPIAADFDNDGELEIAYVTQQGKLNIIDQNGTELDGWPVDTGCSFSNPPVTADIDNDNFIELIALSTTNIMFVYHHDGSEVDFAPVPVNLIGNTPVSIEDVDQDGDYEVIGGISTGAFVIDIKLPKGLKTPWKTYRGNYSRTGFYNDNELFTSAGNELPQAAIASLNQNYPNPFNPVTNISFTLNENAVVDLNVYNIKGQKVRNLIHSNLVEKGMIEMQWNGKDDNGKSVGSGVYLYNLVVDGNNIKTRKCLLLK